MMNKIKSRLSSNYDRYRDLYIIANTDFSIDNILFNLKKLMDERKKIARFLLDENYSESDHKEFFFFFEYTERQILKILNIPTNER